MAMDKKIVEDYIFRECSLKGGHFLMYDPEQKKFLALCLAHPIPDDRLLQISDREWAACVDMRTDKGEPYNLDFLVLEEEACPRIHGISVHEAEGIPRYQWQPRPEGTWRQVPRSA